MKVKAPGDFLLFMVSLMLMANLSLVANAQQIAHFTFNEQTGNNTTIEDISQTVFTVPNHFNRPERIAGIEGNALRLDGYSTWAYNEVFQLSGITDKMSIAVWYAAEAFNNEPGGIVSQLGNNYGFALEVGPFGNLNLVFYANFTKYTLQTSQKPEKYKWYYIVATIDLPNQTARILVNGEQWASRNLPALNSINLGSTTFYLGRHNNNVQNSGFLLTALNGAIDEVSIYKSVLSENEISANYLAHANLIPDLTIDPDTRYAGDYFRPRFHAMPNAMWTNEPYGLTYYNGKYHLFFQKNPNSPTLYFMHWGHLTSPDLVNWEEEKIALAPSPGFDSFGDWSGTTIKNGDGVPEIIYTGVDGAKAGIGLAVSDDDSLIHWTKYSGNPLIPSPPSSYNHMDFRDPYVWESDGTYYMIVGSGIQNSGGGILFTYKSTDLINWTSIDPLYRNVYVDVTGYFWEMPFFYPLNDNNEYILGVNPVPTSQKGAETLYWIGKWENEKFAPYYSLPKKMELINGLMLAPAFGSDTAGRIAYIGIIPEDREANAQIAGEWRHTFSLPRAIRLLNDTAIGQIPHPNLCRLRDSLTQISARVLEPGTGNNIPEFFSNQAELNFTVKADSASRFTIQVLKHEDTQEFTSIFFDLSINKIGFDRAHSSLNPGTPNDYRTADYIFDFRDTINVTIFIDHSVIEVFVDNLAVFSFRVYPTRLLSQKVDMIVNKGLAEIVKLDAWKLHDMNEIVSSEICEPVNLPDRFRQLSDLLGINEIIRPTGSLMLFPNPANKKLNIQFMKNMHDSLEFTIVDQAGNVLIQRHYGIFNESVASVDISRLSPGSYILTVSGRNVKESQLFVVI